VLRRAQGGAARSGTRRQGRLAHRPAAGRVAEPGRHAGRQLANWSDTDVDRYIAEHDIIVNPLLFEGYPSIGCWPCTERVVDGADPRSGRWAGSAKTECGLHL
jgi:phosphoadenosine phosphosulfate reductase